MRRIPDRCTEDGDDCEDHQGCGDLEAELQQVADVVNAQRLVADLVLAFHVGDLQIEQALLPFGNSGLAPEIIERFQRLPSGRERVLHRQRIGGRRRGRTVFAFFSHARLPPVRSSPPPSNQALSQRRTAFAHRLFFPARSGPRPI